VPSRQRAVTKQDRDFSAAVPSVAGRTGLGVGTNVLSQGLCDCGRVAQPFGFRAHRCRRAHPAWHDAGKRAHLTRRSAWRSDTGWRSALLATELAMQRLPHSKSCAWVLLSQRQGGSDVRLCDADERHEHLQNSNNGARPAQPVHGDPGPLICHTFARGPVRSRSRRRALITLVSADRLSLARKERPGTCDERFPSHPVRSLWHPWRYRRRSSAPGAGDPTGR